MSHDFIDEARIFVRSGKGGDGMLHFRREKFEPHGGPDGGDGGKGGDVIFVGNEKINTLRKFSGKVHHHAEDGGRGGTARRTGANGADAIIEVPLGTIIRDADTNTLIADISQPGQRVVVLQGGKGGRGNVHFKSARNQAPTYAEGGDPAQQQWLKLELKLLADVGLVGMPNAGKSTLLSVISNAKPKIADYPFTTLTPNLGLVRYDYRDMVVADIPGLVEGAAQGAGLGHDFLRHIQRTRLLVHLVDGASDDPVMDFQQINTELFLFDERLSERPQLVAITKIDLPQAAERAPELEKTFQEMGYPTLSISAATQTNTQTLVGQLFQMLDELPDEAPEVISEEEIPVYSLPPKAFVVEKLGDGRYIVRGERIEKAVAKMYWWNDAAVRRFQRVLAAMGITQALENAGVQVGDMVTIGDMELEWGE